MIDTFDCEQGSPEWHALRLGIPTASDFSHVIKGAPNDTGEKKSRRAYMLKKAGEILTGEPAGSYDNVHMERGRKLEAEARDLYAFATNTDPKQVGFIRRTLHDGMPIPLEQPYTRAGCSPDALIDDDGMLEIKTALPHILLDIIERDEFPSCHKAQTQGALWVCERQWIDQMVYWPGLPHFIKRAERDEPYITLLEQNVRIFTEELHELVERIKTRNMK